MDESRRSHFDSTLMGMLAGMMCFWRKKKKLVGSSLENGKHIPIYACIIFSGVESRPFPFALIRE